MELQQCDEFYYRITDTNENIYKKFNTSKEGVLRNNYNIPFYAGEWVKIKTNDYLTHIVKPCETLDKVACLYEIDKKDIIFKNALKTEKLFIGQILKIYKEKSH